MSLRVVVVTAALALGVIDQEARLPAGPLAFGAFTAQFRGDGTFSLAGQDWPALRGQWKVEGQRIELVLVNPPEGCASPGRYDFVVSSSLVTFPLAADSCTPRRMILDRSTWRPADDPVVRAVR